MKTAGLLVSLTFLGLAVPALGDEPQTLGLYWVKPAENAVAVTLRELRSEVSGQETPKQLKIEEGISVKKEEVLFLTLNPHAPGTLASRVTKIVDGVREQVVGLYVTEKLDAEGLAEISKLKNLRELHFLPDEYLETESGARWLGEYKRLEKLVITPIKPFEFGSPHFTDAVLKLKHLKYLECPCGKLSNSNVRQIAMHPRLEYVALFSKPLYDGKTLRAFQGSNRLRVLDIACVDELTSSDLHGFSESDSLEILAIHTDASPDIAKWIKRLNKSIEVNIHKPID